PRAPPLARLLPRRRRRHGDPAAPAQAAIRASHATPVPRTLRAAALTRPVCVRVGGAARGRKREGARVLPPPADVSSAVAVRRVGGVPALARPTRVGARRRLPRRDRRADAR